MPQHYGHKELKIVSQSGSTGTQFLQATGAGFALQKNGENGVAYVSSGEGTSSQGDFHEALNWASRDKSPVIFHIENNGYAISVPIEDQTAGASVYKISAGYDNLARFNVDGTDFFETHLAFKKAVERARKGKGPSLIQSDVVRLLPHSSSDDQRKYRAEDELEADRQRDPLMKFSKTCIEAGIAKNEDFELLQTQVKEQIDIDAEWAETQPDPNPIDRMKNVFVQLNVLLKHVYNSI
jgi:2-oxoisovalerate dehydrogenase E1 component